MVVHNTISFFSKWRNLILLKKFWFQKNVLNKTISFSKRPGLKVERSQKLLIPEKLFGCKNIFLSNRPELKVERNKNCLVPEKLFPGMRPSSEGAQIDIKTQENLIKPCKTEGCWSTTGSQWNQQNQGNIMKPCKNEGSWSTKGSEYTPKPKEPL